VILHPVPDGWIAVPQSAHALLAFQLADHWGNRATPRPSPRADVLAAVMLHDAGWDGREELRRLGSDGHPLAFDTWPEEERAAIWSTSVERAAPRGHYVAYLVSHHVVHLATAYSRTPHDAFIAREETRRAALTADLLDDPRYHAVLKGRADAVNRAVVRLADAVAVHLVRGLDRAVTCADLPRRDGNVNLTMRPAAAQHVRLSPWPLEGRILAVHAEGRRLPARRFASEAELAASWSAAPRVRLSWTLLSTGAAAP
jgi:Protein of unknown function (DUF3891)